MARMLFVWELGKGFGHLTRYREMVKALAQRGHEIVYVTRDVGNTARIFAPLGVNRILQAPVMMHPVTNSYKTVYNLAHLLHNVGFADARDITALALAWRQLFDHIQPDVVVFDHAPTALLAALDYPWKRVIAGSGFMIPPDGVPLPALRYWNKYDPARIASEENGVLEVANQALDALGSPRLASLSRLFRADDKFLFGFREMDHYPGRTDGTYLGMFPQAGHGVAPAWPSRLQHRIFAYLYPYDKVGELLGLLAKAQISTLIYAPEIPERTKARYAGARVAFSPDPLDLRQVAKECSLAITNGTFGTTSTFLLHGRPVLCIPDNLERQMVARRVRDLGAGSVVDRGKPEQLKPALSALLRNPRFTQAAKAFARRYEGLDLRWQTRQAVQRLERLLARADA